MGKEAKIGLAVVGVLLLVFAALLVRRFVPLEAMMAESTVTEDDPGVAPNHGAVKPTILTVQKDPPEHEPNQGEAIAWPTRRGTAEPADAPADMPRRGYMPRQVEPAGTESSDRYRQGDPSAQQPDDIPAASSDPFHRAGPRDQQAEASPGAPRELEVAPQDAAALEDRKPQGRAPGNPLRKLSAEVPLDEVPAADEPMSTADAELDLKTVDAPPASRYDESAVAPVESEPPAEPVEATADPTPPRVPLDAQARPRSRVREPAARQADSSEVPLAEPRPLGTNGKYTIEPNDSLWLISEKVYGNGRYFKAIYQHNRNKLPRADQLTVGTVIAVPPASVLEENYPALCPKQRKSVMVRPRAVQASTRQPSARGGDVYVVEAGDTLFDIARYELGKASRWGEIYELNREVLGEDFDYLQPGTELRLPARAGHGDAVTRQPDGAYQR